MVAGHVDGVATVVELTRDAQGTLLTLELPAELTRYVVPRGSIAVDGVSLTVADVSGRRVRVALIPETLRATTAESYRSGTAVNVETDIMAKHQEKLIAGASGEEVAGTGSGLTEERLRELGFTK
jgi:riboflavin synthase